MNTDIRSIISDLEARGFHTTGDTNWHWACGSISHYAKCRIALGYCLYSDVADDVFYSVRYESFAESGDPAIDHHTIAEGYVAASKIAEYMRGKSIYTTAELAARRAELRKRLEERRAQRRMD